MADQIADSTSVMLYVVGEMRGDDNSPGRRSPGYADQPETRKDNQ